MGRNISVGAVESVHDWTNLPFLCRRWAAVGLLSMLSIWQRLLLSWQWQLNIWMGFTFSPFTLNFSLYHRRFGFWDLWIQRRVYSLLQEMVNLIPPSLHYLNSDSVRKQKKIFLKRNRLTLKIQIKYPVSYGESSYQTQLRPRIPSGIAHFYSNINKYWKLLKI